MRSSCSSSELLSAATILMMATWKGVWETMIGRVHVACRSIKLPCWSAVVASSFHEGLNHSSALALGSVLPLPWQIFISGKFQRYFGSSFCIHNMFAHGIRFKQVFYIMLRVCWESHPRFCHCACHCVQTHPGLVNFWCNNSSRMSHWS